MKINKIDLDKLELHIDLPEHFMAANFEPKDFAVSVLALTPCSICRKDIPPDEPRFCIIDNGTSQEGETFTRSFHFNRYENLEEEQKDADSKKGLIQCEECFREGLSALGIEQKFIDCWVKKQN